MFVVQLAQRNRILPGHIGVFKINEQFHRCIKHHSTETALNLTLNNIYTSVDSGHQALLVSFDLNEINESFDAITESILLSRLSASFGALV
jgi:hypothetical protein